MDPLTAIGLASNILSFIDFSARLLKGAKEVHGSQHGVLEENRSRETIVREMQHMSTRILVSESSEKADDTSGGLRVLARECQELSTQLISLLEKIKPKDSGSATQSLASALRNKIYDSDRAGLEARLNNCRAQLHLELSNLTRSAQVQTDCLLDSLI